MGAQAFMVVVVVLETSRLLVPNTPPLGLAGQIRRLRLTAALLETWALDRIALGALCTPAS